MIIVAGLASGLAVISSLALLGKLVPDPVRALLPLLASLGTMGLIALAGIYLRILDLPRQGFPYLAARSAAWAFFMISYADYGLAAGRKAVWLLSAAIAVGLAFIDIGGHPLWRSFIVWISSLSAVWVAVASGRRALREAGAVSSVPIRAFYRTFGRALSVFAPAYLLDIAVTRLLILGGLQARDGLVFSTSYLLINILLLKALFLSLNRGAPDVREDRNIPGPLAAAYGLSPREAEVAEAVLQGKQDKRIAHELRISPRTVSTHIGNIFRKCGVNSRAELFHIAARYGKLRKDD